MPRLGHVCALVELPPQKGDLSMTTTLPPCSRIVCAADMPARPPPTTITCVVRKRGCVSRYDVVFAPGFVGSGGEGGRAVPPAVWMVSGFGGKGREEERERVEKLCVVLLFCNTIVLYLPTHFGV